MGPRKLACIGAIAFLLFGCGGSDDDGRGNTQGANSWTGNSSAANILFAADIAHNAIGRFSDLNPAPGTALSGEVISGFSEMGPSLAYDASRDQLYVPSAGSVAVLNNASAASGAAVIDRTITPAGVAFLGRICIFLDKKNDVLYIGGERQYDGAIAVISHASTASGAVTPDRVIRISEGVGFFVVDTARSLLYVLNATAGVHVFRNLNSTAGGFADVNFFRVNGDGLALDEARDRLYVSDPSAGIHFIDGASKADNDTPHGTISGLSNPHFVTLDAANDRLYVGAYSLAYILNSASTLASGQSNAVAALAPAKSSVAGFAFP